MTLIIPTSDPDHNRKVLAVLASLAEGATPVRRRDREYYRKAFGEDFAASLDRALGVAGYSALPSTQSQAQEAA